MKETKNTTQVKSEPSNIALSIYKDDVKGVFNLVKIMYNPLTKEVSTMETLVTELDRAAINERFKIEVVNSGLLG